MMSRWVWVEGGTNDEQVGVGGGGANDEWVEGV